MTALRILIACETSGVMRRAFAARGHDVWSCDLLPAEDGSNRHIVTDVRDILHDGWDLMAVMHPPCTRLCRTGRQWMSGPGKWTQPKRLPRGRSVADLRAPHIVQPFWFGEPAYKATGFYLRGLPQLLETNRLPEPERGSVEWKAWNAIHRASPGPDRWKIRSRTFKGVAEACADQWGGTAAEAQERTRCANT